MRHKIALVVTAVSLGVSPSAVGAAPLGCGAAPVDVVVPLPGGRAGKARIGLGEVQLDCDDDTERRERPSSSVTFGGDEVLHGDPAPSGLLRGDRPLGVLHDLPSGEIRTPDRIANGPRDLARGGGAANVGR